MQVCVCVRAQVCMCVNIPIIHTRKLSPERLLLPKPTRVGLETFLNLNPLKKKKTNKNFPLSFLPLTLVLGGLFSFGRKGSVEEVAHRGPGSRGLSDLDGGKRG